MKELESNLRSCQSACALATAEAKVAVSGRIAAEDRAVELEAQLEATKELQLRTGMSQKDRESQEPKRKRELGGESFLRLRIFTFMNDDSKRHPIYVCI
jgi:hypothetical protein